MIRAASHLVVATDDVPRLAGFFADLFSVVAHFANDQFTEFVLPSKFRIAFFKPVGAAAKFFVATKERGGCAFGVTVDDVDETYARATAGVEKWGLTLSGPPKTHPWGEKSFLLVDCDGNRWELAQTPSADGMLIPKDFGKH